MGSGLIFYYLDRGWTSQRINLPVDVSFFSFGLAGLFPHSEINVNYQTPKLFLEDWDGDGTKELLAICNEQLWVYKRNSKNFYSSQPIARLSFPLPTPDKKAQRQQFNILIADLDNDGFADALTNLQQGGIFNQKAQLCIYSGKNLYRHKLKPKRSWEYNAWIIGPFIRDLDNDGDVDLIIPIVEAGFFTTARVLITGYVPLQWNYYFNHQHHFNDLPDYTDRIDLHLDLSEGKFTTGFPNVFADFNGDGVADHVYSKSEDELIIDIKDNSGARKYKEIVSVASVGLPITKDFNQDGLADIFIYYPQSPEHRGEINVLVNKGGW